MTLYLLITGAATRQTPTCMQILLTQTLTFIYYFFSLLRRQVKQKEKKGKEINFTDV